MGTGSGSARAVAFHGPHGRAFSLEFSLAAVFSFGRRNLCGRSVARSAGIGDPSRSGACSNYFDGRCDGDPAYNWFERFSANVDLCWARGDLVTVDALLAWLRTSAMGGGGEHIPGVTPYVSLHSVRLRCSQVQFLTETA